MLTQLRLFNTLLFLLFIFLSGCSEEQKLVVKKEAPPMDVNVIQVKKEAVSIWKQYTGTTKASSDQEVRARVSGVLEKIYFKDGELVKKGDKLFKIEQAKYISLLNSAKAKKAVDEASLRLALADAARYKPLVDEGLAPRATFEKYQAQVAGLKASIAGDVAEINKAKLELSYTIIKAPISGKMSARRIDIGNLVGQGEATLLTSITKIDPLYAYFSPSQDDVRLFKKYRNKDKPYAYIELDGSRENIRLDGFVDFENNTVDPLTSTITMRATIKNADYSILPGSFVYVNLFINDKYEFLMLPPEVILRDQLGKFVYVVDENSKVKRVDVTTDYATKYYVSVKSGLKDGDRVIVSSLVKLKKSMSVQAHDVTDAQGIQAVLKKHNLIPKKN
ncbi:MAG: efflux RND transporter periplasmic adaptor subunit [Sulfurimonas sp.]|nr:efflux RND transporter periplasmic adaptor subunit [Sulfurimonas sp.]